MATTKTPQAPKGTATTAQRQQLRVIAKRDGFRRGGREWHGTTTVYVDELTPEQLSQIQAEPMLVTLPENEPTAQADSACEEAGA